MTEPNKKDKRRAYDFYHSDISILKILAGLRAEKEAAVEKAYEAGWLDGHNGRRKWNPGNILKATDKAKEE